MQPVIKMDKIIKRYYIGQPNELQILNGIDLEVNQNEFVSIVGESGSGKSTLMNIIGALDRPTEGTYFLDGENIGDMNDTALSKIRNQKIGFVFQSFFLIPRTSAIKNVELPMMYAGVSKKQRRERAMELLELVGMADRANHKPNELSGGQNQRVAIARALSNNPSIILADEPTGALDYKTSKEILKLIETVNQKFGNTVILVTHNDAIRHMADQVIKLHDGQIRHNDKNEQKIPAVDLDW